MVLTAPNAMTAGAVVQGKKFKGRQFTAEVILWVVRWYLMFSISYSDLGLMLRDRGEEIDHSTSFAGSRLTQSTGEADPASSAPEQWLLAGRRDLCSREGPVDVPVSGGGQPRAED